MAPPRNDVSADMVNEDIPTGGTAHISAMVAAVQIPNSATTRSVALFRHGSLLVKYYAPRGKDLQTPHTRDELYVVAQGRGVFFNGTSRHPFVPGDLLFAAAARERFVVVDKQLVSNRPVRRLHEGLFGQQSAQARE